MRIGVTLRLDREIDAKRTADDVEAGISERHGLEALRGYEIGKSKVEGAVGAPHLSRDGLETLLTAKSITKTQHAAAIHKPLHDDGALFVIQLYAGGIDLFLRDNQLVFQFLIFFF